MAAKDEIRQAMKAKRAKMTHADCRHAGETIAQIAIAQNAANLLSRYNIFASFISFGNEASSDSLNVYLMRAGKHLCVPRWSDTSQAYAWAPLHYDTPLRKGPYGVLEPMASERFPRGEIQVAFIPGLAFDTHGGRLGFGAGFYDRLIAGLKPNVLKVGICFDFQVSSELLPQEPHDQRMDLIITDSAWIDTHRAKRANSDKGRIYAQ